MGDTLVMKIKRTESLIKNKEIELHTILGNVGGSIDCVERWRNEETAKARVSPRKHETLTKEEDYATLLDQIYTKEPPSQPNDSQERMLQNKERQLHISSRWTPLDKNYIKNLTSAKRKRGLVIVKSIQKSLAEKKYILNLLTKHSDGQAVAIRLLRQLKKTEEHLKSLVHKYNSEKLTEETCLPTSVDISSVKKEDSDFWTIMAVHQNEIVHTTQQLNAIDLYVHIKRGQEEITLLKTEMSNLLHFVQHEHSVLLSSINHIENMENRENEGRLSFLKTTAACIECWLLSLGYIFAEYIDVPDFNTEIVASCTQIIEKLKNPQKDYENTLETDGSENTGCEVVSDTSESESDDDDPSDDSLF